MLLQIFILEACPDLEETKGDKRHAHIYIHTHSVLDVCEAADIWQQAAEQQENPSLHHEHLACLLHIKQHVTSQKT